MIYNNLIYLLIVIFILITNNVPDIPQFYWSIALPVFLIKGFLFYFISRFLFKRVRRPKAQHYFAAEQQGAILAIVAFAVDVYLLDSQYYFNKLPFAAHLPVIANLGGILLFFSYFSMIWLESARCYYLVFGRKYTRRSFLYNNIKTNLPIILPWLTLSLCSDLLQLSTLPFIKEFLASPWGEPAVFLIFFAILAISFPVVITRLWNCTPLPPGETRRKIEEFCRRQKLGYADILLWPLFEGQMLTAGVMGLVKRFRYLLVTPALIDAMTSEEIEAVMAHEIGHVKRHHMLLYLFLFIGFGLLAELSRYPILYALMNSDLFYTAARVTHKGPDAVMAFMSTAPLFLLMIIYFRFVFGFFMRNFERQADLHVFRAMKFGSPLVQVLEKIAALSGDIRDLPSWHHFGISQRVDYLKKSAANPAYITRHNRKVLVALSAYFLVIITGSLLLWKIPSDLLEGAPREKYIEAVLLQKIDSNPKNPIWYQLLGDLQYSRKLYSQAILAYEAALAIAPNQPEILNNLAWLLLTADDQLVLDANRALTLAREAAHLNPTGYILDTLATAYWQNDFVELAITTEQKAISKDAGNEKFYREQVEKFARETPPNSSQAGQSDAR